MGGGYSLDTPACACRVTSGELPYNVYAAAINGHVNTVRKYLTDNGDVHAQYKGQTMLHAACANGRENVLKTLLCERGLCLNVRNRYNETALMLAAQNGYEDCVMNILTLEDSCPLEMHCKNAYDRKAIDLAHINNHHETAYCIMSYLKNKHPPMEDKRRNNQKDENIDPDAPPPYSK